MGAMQNETTAAGKVVVITGASSGPVAYRRASTRARSRRACGRHRPRASSGCGASWSSSRRSSAQVATDIVGGGVAAVATCALDLLEELHEVPHPLEDRKSTRLNSSHQITSYA